MSAIDSIRISLSAGISDAAARSTAELYEPRRVLPEMPMMRITMRCGYGQGGYYARAVTLHSMSHGEVESAYAWTRLAVTLTLSTIGGVGMWSVVVALPAVQAEFGVARADASLPYTLTMISFGLSGIVMGRLSDRYGVMAPVMLGTLLLALGYVTARSATSIGYYTLAQGVLIGAGSSATFA